MKAAGCSVPLIEEHGGKLEEKVKVAVRINDEAERKAEFALQ